MPLFTDNIDEARLAYTNMESRAHSAEFLASVLQDKVDTLNSQISINAQLATLLSQHTADQEATNAQLSSQQGAQVSPDIPLTSFIANIGMAGALGEATMADRSVPSITTTVTCYHTPDGGIRFYQPEWGDSGGFGTTTFSILKTPSASGAPAPRTLYVILQYAQTVFDTPFWMNLANSGTPPVGPAQQILAEVTQMLANAVGWTFAYLVQEASTIAGLEARLGAALAAPVSAQQIAAFNASVQALSVLVKALDPAVKPVPVAGDVLALSAALDATLRIADALKS